VVVVNVVVVAARAVVAGAEVWVVVDWSALPGLTVDVVGFGAERFGAVEVPERDDTGLAVVAGTAGTGTAALGTVVGTAVVAGNVVDGAVEVVVVVDGTTNGSTTYGRVGAPLGREPGSPL